MSVTEIESDDIMHSVICRIYVIFILYHIDITLNVHVGISNDSVSKFDFNMILYVI